MADVVSPEKISQMMSGIKGKNTKPEFIVRKALYERGLRYRLHQKKLPDNPDLVFRKYKTVIFINGCFWHGHDCHLFKWPKSNVEFWKEKIGNTRKRDKKNIDKLLEAGWRVIVIWECALRGKKEDEKQRLIDQVENEIRSNISEILILHAR